MGKADKHKFQPYIVIMCIFLLITIFALTIQTPSQIFKGLISLNLTRGALITDYIEIVGIGAALMNGVLMGVITVAFFIRFKIVPTGITIMAIFLTVGFSLFGKNLLTMVPITFGVWLYSKAIRKPFTDFYITALLAATISPITSEIIFLNIYSMPVNIILGILLGSFAGFLFPMLTAFTSKIHGGYNLYNMGFVGGLLATFFIAFLTSIGIDVVPEFYVSGGNNYILSIFLYSISLLLIIFGLIFSERKTIIPDLLSMMKCSGKYPSDYYTGYGACVYINMGLLCAFATTLVLILGAELNGPTIAGILTITGFGALGKHLKNILPLVIGAVIAAKLNKWDSTYPTNILTILFCTGLSPISGQYGVLWGMFAGFVHVCIAHHLGYLSSGLNLYSNGFAAGFVVLIIIPIIEGTDKILHKRKSIRAYTGL